MRIISFQALTLLLCTAPVHGETIFAPDHSVDAAGFESLESGVKIFTTKKGEQSVLEIRSEKGKYRIRSPKFMLKPNYKIGARQNNLLYLGVTCRVAGEGNLGSVSLSLKIFDKDTSYIISLENFAGNIRREGKSLFISKPLCAVTTTHPNLRWAHGTRPARLILDFEKAPRRVTINELKISRRNPGNPGFSSKEWDRFESGDGVHYWITMCQGMQPMYALSKDYASPLLMDSSFKLLRAAGWNMNREWITWGPNFRKKFDTRPEILNQNPEVKSGAGNADYRKSITEVVNMVDRLAYYGFSSMICIQGSPDWTHPAHQGVGTHKGFENRSVVNGLGKTYPGPHYASPEAIGGHWLYPPDDWKDWRDLAVALGGALKGRQVVYEIINEINVAKQGAVVGGYKAVLLWTKHFREAVKTVDPQCQVLAGACDKMLAGLVADGVMKCCDGVAYHNYTGNLEHTRGIVESSGVKKHIWMNEHHGLHPELRKKVRGQGKWTTFSVFRSKNGLNDHPIIVLRDSKDQQVQADAPRGKGDRVDIAGEYVQSGRSGGGLIPKDSHPSNLRGFRRIWKIIKGSSESDQ